MKQFTFVILHGWGLSKEKFSGLTDTLRQQGYRVFTPDLPGFGETIDPVEPLILSDYVEFLREYLESHKIVKPIIIGHSFGGRVALKYVSLYPDHIRAIILTGTPGVTPVAKKKIALALILAKFGKWIFSFPGLSVVREKIRAWFYWSVGARDFYRASPVMRETFKNIVNEELTAYMRVVHIPCALIWGENDIITPPWIATRMQSMIKGSLLMIIPEGDHGVSYKQPKVFVNMLEKFLKQL